VLSREQQVHERAASGARSCANTQIVLPGRSRLHGWASKLWFAGLAGSSADPGDAGLVLFGGKDDWFSSLGFACLAGLALLERRAQDLVGQLVDARFAWRAVVDHEENGVQRGVAARSGGRANGV
jgi:hypothetical protein